MLSGQDLLLILFVAILLFGANKVPELARSLGKATGEFKKGQRESELELRDIGRSHKEQTMEEKSSLKIEQMAKDMGIATEGKSVEQLLDEIQKKMPTVKSNT